MKEENGSADVADVQDHLRVNAGGRWWLGPAARAQQDLIDRQRIGGGGAIENVGSRQRSFARGWPRTPARASEKARAESRVNRQGATGPEL